jgi:hypothetical protein
MPLSKKKKEADYAALASPFMRIPRVPTEVARDLMDLGLREVYELQGRAPEVLFAELRKLRPDTPESRLPYLRLAVYFAENPEPERGKLHPEAWRD